MLATTPPYYDYNWTVRPGLDAALTKKLTDAFLKLDPAKPAMKEIMDAAARLEVHPDQRPRTTTASRRRRQRPG